MRAVRFATSTTQPPKRLPHTVGEAARFAALSPKATSEARKANDTRNVSIIAHVDHGKTTLADALLHKAGKLTASKAGDQKTGRELDGLSQERERGITIKSTGISLEYHMGDAFFKRADAQHAARLHDGSSTSVSNETVVASSSSSASSSDEDPGDSTTSDVYVGGLPRTSIDDVSVDQMRSGLASAARCSIDAVTNVRVNNKRQFAFATIPARALPALLEAASHGSVMVNDHPVTVARRGTSSVKQLAEVLQAQRYPPAQYHVVSHDNTEDVNASVGWVGTARVDGLGLVAAPNALSTRKEVREYLATALLDMASPAHAKQDAKQDPKGTSGPAAADDNDAGTASDGPTVVVTAAAATEALVAAAAAPALSDVARTLTVNLIDSPGHVDFNAEVTSALRMTDGALVVVDAVDGSSAQTETVLRQALREGVRPVLMLNKVDRLLLQKQYSPDQVYDRFNEVIGQINCLIAETHPGDEYALSLEAGTVAFGSGYFQWAATLDTFVTAADPLLTDPAARAKLRRKLASKKNFVKHVLAGIFKVHSQLGFLHDGVDPPADLTSWLVDFNDKLKHKGRQPMSMPKNLDTVSTRTALKLAMSSLLPAADALVEMMSLWLPSPLQAQATRAAGLVPLPTSPTTQDEDVAEPEETDEKVDVEAQAISLTRSLVAQCDATAPLVIYVSKICRPREAGSSHGGGLAICRCFSGTVRPGQMVKLAGSGRSAKVTAVQMCVGRTMQSMSAGHAGQIFALAGVAGLLRKNGTLTDVGGVAPLRGMSFSVSPVVQKSVRPADRRQLQKMVDALRKTTQADQTALFYFDQETNEHVLAGAGELHLEVLLHEVEEEFHIKILASEPMVSFRESVTAHSEKPALKKSANKLNRVWFTAQPLDPALVTAMDAGDVDGSDTKALSRALIVDYGWDRHVARRVWAVGPEPLAVSGGHDGGDGDAMGMPTCILVNATTGLQIPGDVRDTIVSAFKRVCREGVLAGEQLHGVRFDLVDGMFHADSNHRSGAQLDPAVRSALRGAVAYASPCIVEPLYRLEVSGPSDAINATYAELTGRRRGKIVDSTTNTLGTQGTIVAEMPIRLAFGLTEAIRGVTSGKGFLMTSFAGWSLVEGNVLAVGDDASGGEARDLIRSIRTSKKQAADPPTAADFVDKL
eukprot:m.161646 g.161646  ORF g.161646 m.161646 type:complete len:1155 (-) comp12103_c0_seq1:327-3791(-)